MFHWSCICVCMLQQGSHDHNWGDEWDDQLDYASIQSESLETLGNKWIDRWMYEWMNGCMNE